MNGPEAPAALTLQNLSASLAHELNNLIASLHGFIALGSALAGHDTALKKIFAEAGISADRVTAVVADLEVLATGPAKVEHLVPGQLMATSQASFVMDPRHALPPVEWESDAGIAVLADPAQFIHAMRLMHRLAGPGAAPLRYRIEAPGRPLHCQVCGAGIPGRAAWLIQELPAGKVRTLTAPLQRSHLSMDRLRLALLSDANHPTGAHVVLGSEPDHVALVLPLA